MYTGKYIKGSMSVGDFIRNDKGAEMIYEVIEGTTSQAMGMIQSHVSRYQAKTIMQKLLLVDDKEMTVTPVIKVTLLTPAKPREQSGIKKGTKRR